MNKYENIDINLTHKEWEEVFLAAERLNMSVNEFVNEVIKQELCSQNVVKQKDLGLKAINPSNIVDEEGHIVGRIFPVSE